MEFLAPLKPVAIRIVKNAHGNKTGEVWVSGARGSWGRWEVEAVELGTLEGWLFLFLFVAPGSVDWLDCLGQGSAYPWQPGAWLEVIISRLHSCQWARLLL